MYSQWDDVITEFQKKKTATPSKRQPFKKPHDLQTYLSSPPIVASSSSTRSIPKPNHRRNDFAFMKASPRRPISNAAMERTRAHAKELAAISIPTPSSIISSSPSILDNNHDAMSVTSNASSSHTMDFIFQTPHKHTPAKNHTAPTTTSTKKIHTTSPKKMKKKKNIQPPSNDAFFHPLSMKQHLSKQQQQQQILSQPDASCASSTTGGAAARRRSRHPSTTGSTIGMNKDTTSDYFALQNHYHHQNSLQDQNSMTKLQKKLNSTTTTTTTTTDAFGFSIDPQLLDQEVSAAMKDLEMEGFPSIKNFFGETTTTATTISSSSSSSSQQQNHRHFQKQNYHSSTSKRKNNIDDNNNNDDLWSSIEHTQMEPNTTTTTAMETNFSLFQQDEQEQIPDHYSNSNDSYANDFSSSSWQTNEWSNPGFVPVRNKVRKKKPYEVQNWSTPTTSTIQSQTKQDEGEDEEDSKREFSIISTMNQPQMMIPKKEEDQQIKTTSPSNSKKSWNTKSNFKSISSDQDDAMPPPEQKSPIREKWNSKKQLFPRSDKDEPNNNDNDDDAQIIKPTYNQTQQREQQSSMKSNSIQQQIQQQQQLRQEQKRTPRRTSSPIPVFHQNNYPTSSHGKTPTTSPLRKWKEPEQKQQHNTMRSSTSSSFSPIPQSFNNGYNQNSKSTQRKTKTLPPRAPSPFTTTSSVGTRTPPRTHSPYRYNSHKTYYNTISAPSSPGPPISTLAESTSPFQVTLRKSPGPSSSSDISAGQSSSVFSQVRLRNTGAIDKLLNNASQTSSSASSPNTAQEKESNPLINQEKRSLSVPTLSNTDKDEINEQQKQSTIVKKKMTYRERQDLLKREQNQTQQKQPQPQPSNPQQNRDVASLIRRRIAANYHERQKDSNMDTTEDREGSNNIIDNTDSIAKEIPSRPENKKLSYREKQELLRQQEKEQQEKEQQMEDHSNVTVPKEKKMTYREKQELLKQQKQQQQQQPPEEETAPERNVAMAIRRRIAANRRNASTNQSEKSTDVEKETTQTQTTGGGGNLDFMAMRNRLKKVSRENNAQKEESKNTTPASPSKSVPSLSETKNQQSYESSYSKHNQPSSSPFRSESPTQTNYLATDHGRQSPNITRGRNSPFNYNNQNGKNMTENHNYSKTNEDRNALTSFSPKINHNDAIEKCRDDDDDNDEATNATDALMNYSRDKREKSVLSKSNTMSTSTASMVHDNNNDKEKEDGKAKLSALFGARSSMTTQSKNISNEDGSGAADEEDDKGKLSALFASRSSLMSKPKHVSNNDNQGDNKNVHISENNDSQSKAWTNQQNDEDNDEDNDKKHDLHSSSALFHGKPILKEDPKYTKYFKMLKVGMPLQVVQHCMERDGLDPSILEGDHNKPAGYIPGAVPLKDDPEFAKYFKMLKMGLPMGAVKNAMVRDGLNPVILDGDHNAPVPRRNESKLTKKSVSVPKDNFRRTRLHWDTLGKVRSTSVWAMVNKDPDLEQIEIDENEFAQLFQAEVGLAETNADDSTKKSKKQNVVKVIDPKRANNGGIILARLKMSYDDMARAVDKMYVYMTLLI